jgi:hypothetical protein
MQTLIESKSTLNKRIHQIYPDVFSNSLTSSDCKRIRVLMPYSLDWCFDFAPKVQVMKQICKF